MSEARTLQVLCECVAGAGDRRKSPWPATWILILLLLIDAPRMLHVAISPKDQVMEGKKAILTCESDANPPVLQYTWFDWKNQNLHHYDQMLRLDPVKIQHSGAYRCEATNQLGRVQSPPSTLTVYCKSPPGPSSPDPSPAILWGGPAGHFLLHTGSPVCLLLSRLLPTLSRRVPSRDAPTCQTSWALSFSVSPLIGCSSLS